MFTGIIESLATVSDIKSIDASNKKLIVDVDPNIKPKLGDSIAINGCCLTVVNSKEEQDKTVLDFDVSIETLRCTNLGDLGKDSQVNIERAMIATSRFDGHMVSGHVDCCGYLVKKEMDHDFCLIQFEIKEQSLFKQFVKKGSICINGVSLTINQVHRDSPSIRVEITLIPETLKRTNLGQLDIGSRVNIESDVIAKYIETMMPLYANMHSN